MHTILCRQLMSRILLHHNKASVWLVWEKLKHFLNPIKNNKNKNKFECWIKYQVWFDGPSMFKGCGIFFKSVILQRILKTKIQFLINTLYMCRSKVKVAGGISAAIGLCFCISPTKTATSSNRKTLSAAATVAVLHTGFPKKMPFLKFFLGYSAAIGKVK